MIETWILAGGRWKVISQRGLTHLVIAAVVLAWIGGALCGVEVMNVAYGKRINAVQRRIDAMEKDVEMLKRWVGVK